MKIKCTPVFDKNYNSTGKIVVNRGGTRSSKTYSLCQQIAMWMLTGKFRENLELEHGVLRVVRKYQTTIKQSVQVDFEDVLDAMELWGEVQHNKVDKSYSILDGTNKRTVVFSGADDQQKLRGMKQDILYCNEANELSYNQEFFQLLMRTRLITVLDFNPDDEDVWINVELEKKRAEAKGDVDVIVSTYKDNPLLPQQMVDEIEYLEHTDPSYWQIYGKGEYGKIRGLVFPDWEEVIDVPQTARFLGYGQDFGYTNDPTTLVGVYLKETGAQNELYFDELLYERELTNNEIADNYNYLGIDVSDEIIADSADPKSIQELCDRGYNVKPATKGKDSILFGVNLIKQHKLFVTQKSVNTKKELKKYKWIENKDGVVLNKPIDKFNHAIDAIRYIVTDKIEPNAITQKTQSSRKSLEMLKARLRSQRVLK